MIKAKVIADSVSVRGHRLTTIQVTGHRFVLSEFNTHRVFSRNSASSRAIPVTKRLDDIITNPASPVEWPSEKPGMQGGTPLEGEALSDAQKLWVELAEDVVAAVHQYIEEHPDPETRLHKSLLNRLIEPWLWHTIVVTSTEWENFFRQRCSPLAQPEIRLMAEAMREALEASEPASVDWGEWHLPYLDDEARAQAYRMAHRGMGVDLRGVSAARCARVSYLTQEGKRDITEDLRLYERLCNPGDGPPHASPLEHVATPCEPKSYVPGNFRGWRQLRHEVLGF